MTSKEVDYSEKDSFLALHNCRKNLYRPQFIAAASVDHPLKFCYSHSRGKTSAQELRHERMEEISCSVAIQRAFLVMKYRLEQ